MVPRITLALVMATATSPRLLSQRQQSENKPKTDLVVAGGCARAGTVPHIWTLTAAAERRITTNPFLSAAEAAEVEKLLPGKSIYELVGVADFVPADKSRQIGDRSAIYPENRVNTTSQLLNGHHVAVKGLFIGSSPPRINLTSVVDLGSDCS